MFLYITTDGATINKNGGRFVIHYPESMEQKGQEIPISLVEGIVVFGRSQVSTDAIRACLTQKIPVFFLSKSGNLFGKLDSLENKNVDLLYNHIKASLDQNLSLQYIKAFIISKIGNNKVMLQRRKRFFDIDIDFSYEYNFLEQIKEKVYQADNADTIRGLEGVATREYFSAFGKCIKEPFSFSNRNRRPPQDPINSLLSLGYTLLAQSIQMVLGIQGVDPQIGFFHKPKDLKPLLVLDIMEMFRAWIVDDLILRLTRTEKIKLEHFNVDEDSIERPVLLTDDGLKLFLREYYKVIFKTDGGEPDTLKNNFVKLRAIEDSLGKFKQSLVNLDKSYEGFKIK